MPGGFEYATAIPFPRAQSLQESPDSTKEGKGHVRWIMMNPQKGTGKTLNELSGIPLLTKVYEDRKKAYIDQGEEVMAVENESIEETTESVLDPRARMTDWRQRDYEAYFNHKNPILNEPAPKRRFQRLWGENSFGLYFCGSDEDSASEQRKADRYRKQVERGVSLSMLRDVLLSDDLDRECLLNQVVIELENTNRSNLNSLAALALAVQVYKLLPYATIDIRVLTSPLSNSSWIPSTSPDNFEDMLNIATFARPPVTLEVDLADSLDSDSDDDSTSIYSPPQLETTHHGRIEVKTTTSFTPLRSAMLQNYSRISARSTQTVKRLLVRELHPLKALNRPRAFACIVMFESGQYNLAPGLFEDVMAVSSGDSIFVAAPLLCDPSEKPEAQEIRCILGNIGRAGIALLVPPVTLRIRKPGLNTWKLINHSKFDGVRQDTFQDTSLHLSFTGYKLPLDVGTSGAQDTELYRLESLISVYEHGKWVADLDILKSIHQGQVQDIGRYTSEAIVQDTQTIQHGTEARAACRYSSGSPSFPKEPIIALESWTEFLERPKTSSIVQAHRNWQARLAAYCLSVTQGSFTVLAPDECCWKCFTDHIVAYSKESIANKSPGENGNTSDSSDEEEVVNKDRGLQQLSLTIIG